MPGDREKTSRYLSRVYRVGLYVSITLLLVGVFLHRMELKHAAVIAKIGTISLISTPIAGLIFLSVTSLKLGDKKTGITSFALLVLIFLAVGLFQAIR